MKPTNINPLSWILWALFANDEDGYYGTAKWRIDTFGADMPPSFYVALRWWLRNPLHNLFWHVLVWPSSMARVLFSWRKIPSGEISKNWWYKRPPQMWQSASLWDERQLPITSTNEFPQLTIQLAPFFISFRDLGGMEGYIGFRNAEGRLGAALRKYKSTGA